MATKIVLMQWWNRLSWDSRMIMSCSSQIVGIDFLSSWMIIMDVSLHCAFIFLAMESSMTLAAAPESTKQLWTF